jgi:hypothetical protein
MQLPHSWNRFKNDSRIFYSLLFVVFAGAITYDTWFLLRYPVALGIDGYYYVVQVNTILSQGHLYFPFESVPLHYLMALVSLLLGDTVLAIKLIAISLHALLAAGVFGIVKQLTSSRWLGFVGVVLVSFSDLRYFMITEYLKYLAAVVLLSWALYSLIRLLRSRRIGWLLLILCLIGLASFTHRSTLGLLAIFCQAALLSGLLLITNNKLLRFCGWLLLVIFLLLPSLIILIGLDLPVLIQREISFSPHWPLKRTAFVQAGVLLLVCPLLLLLTALYRRSKPTLADFIGTALAVLTITWTVNPFLNSDAGWTSITGRLGGLSYIQLAILTPLLVWSIHRYFGGLRWYAFALFPLMVVSIHAPMPFGLDDEFLRRRTLIVERLSQLPRVWPEDSVIIAAHGDQFVVTAILGIASQQSLPTRTYTSTFWMVDNLDRKYVSEETIEVSSSIFILPTDSLLRVLEVMPSSEQGKLLNSNYHLQEIYGLRKSSGR